MAKVIYFLKKVSKELTKKKDFMLCILLSISHLILIFVFYFSIGCKNMDTSHRRSLGGSNFNRRLPQRRYNIKNYKRFRAFTGH